MADGCNIRVVRFDEIAFDLDNLDLRFRGRPLNAPLAVLRMLRLFVENPNQLITKDDLIAHGWQRRLVADNAVDVAISRLRKLLNRGATDRDILVTVYGRGYRFVRPLSNGSSCEHALATIPDAAAHAVVGRRHVLRQLRDALHLARSGHGGACVLAGEPGIGKTHLLEAFGKEAAAMRMPVVWAHCHELSHASPLQPLAQLIRGLLASHACEQMSSLDELRQLHSQLVPLDVCVVDGTAPTPRVLDTLLAALGACSTLPPCVLVLDDLQRADASLLELLRHWLDELAQTNILLLMAIREPNAMPERNYNAARGVLGHRNTTRIALTRLRESDVADYIQVPPDVDRADAARVVFQKSEGHPFYMTELARLLRVADTCDVRAIEVPSAARDLIRQQLAMLDDEARQALCWAAVIGRTFDLSTLRAVTGANLARLMTSLDAACATGTICVTSYLSTHFTFTHELLRAELYEAVAPAERRRWHLTVARELEQRWLAGELVALDDVAHQFRSAVPEGDLSKAVTYCMRAALALRVDRHADSLRYVHYAREVVALLDDRTLRKDLNALLTRALNGDWEPLMRLDLCDDRYDARAHQHDEPEHHQALVGVPISEWGLGE
jgi:DNA-binding winged helix-turn-helix (wHTH) protein